MTVRSLAYRPRPVAQTIIDRARQLVAVWRPEQEQAMDITNRTVFIAGATSGIGLELARRFAAAGEPTCSASSPLRGSPPFPST
jgi:hypothetical protein